MYYFLLRYLKILWRKTPYGKKKQITKILKVVTEKLDAEISVVVEVSEENETSTIIFEATREERVPVKDIWQKRYMNESCKSTLYKLLEKPHCPIDLTRMKIRDGLTKLIAVEMDVNLVRIEVINGSDYLDRTIILYVGFKRSELSTHDKFIYEEVVSKLRNAL